jgi:hypothetical protein
MSFLTAAGNAVLKINNTLTKPYRVRMAADYQSARD